MTFEAFDNSAQGSRPAELLTFSYGGVTVRNTTYGEDLTVDGNLYPSAAISISEVEASPERPRNNLRLDVPRDHPIADLFRVSPPTQVIALTYGRVQLDDPDEEIITPWLGRVLNADWQSGAYAQLLCEPVSTSQTRNGNTRKYSRTCPYRLYGPDCSVPLASFQTSTTVTGLSGLGVTVAAVTSGQSYRGGYITWVDDSGLDQHRYIDSQTGTALTITLPFSGLEIGDTVLIAPGCDHSLSTCGSQFGNALNYGGFPLIPTKNPFAGDPIF